MSCLCIANPIICARKAARRHGRIFAWQEKMDAVDGTAEVIIGKNRHGPTGTAKMAFEDRFTRFTDLLEDDHLPERMD